MHSRIYRKFLLHISILGILISIFAGFYDVIFHFLWEMIHLTMEVLEESLDVVVESLFETGLHETQMIVFYILLCFGGIVIYIIWKLLVHFVSGMNKDIIDEWVEMKIALLEDWENLSLAEKIGCAVLFIFLNYLVSFLFF